MNFSLFYFNTDSPQFLRLYPHHLHRFF